MCSTWTPLLLPHIGRVNRLMPPKKPQAQSKTAPVTDAPPQHPVIYLEFSTTRVLEQPNFDESEEAHVPPQGPRVIGRIEFELFSDVVPKTSENFRQLCLGAVVGDKKAKESKTCSYRGTRILRMTDSMIQMGDVTHREDGRGQECIYGAATFDDEHFGAVSHERGTLTMVNSGPNTNGCQFAVCLNSAPYLNSLHVSFAKMLPGPSNEEALALLIDELGMVEDVDRNGKFGHGCPVTISACGMSETPAPPPPGNGPRKSTSS